MLGWLLTLAAIAWPLIAWLIFAALVWLSGEWESASYAIGWTLNMAVLGVGFMIAAAAPTALIAAAATSIQERRVRRRGWR